MRSVMPIQSHNEALKPRVRSVPWALFGGDLCEHRCQANHGGQTLERIAERMGFSADEALAVICNLPWKANQFGDEQTCHRVLYMMAARYRTGVLDGGRIAARAANAEEATKLIREHIQL